MEGVFVGSGSFPGDGRAHLRSDLDTPWGRGAAVLAGEWEVCVSLHRVGGVCRERQFFGHRVESDLRLALVPSVSPKDRLGPQGTDRCHRRGDVRWCDLGTPGIAQAVPNDFASDGIREADNTGTKGDD